MTATRVRLCSSLGQRSISLKILLLEVKVKSNITSLSPSYWVHSLCVHNSVSLNWSSGTPFITEIDWDWAWIRFHIHRFKWEVATYARTSSNAGLTTPTPPPPQMLILKLSMQSCLVRLESNLAFKTLALVPQNPHWWRRHMASLGHNVLNPTLTSCGCKQTGTLNRSRFFRT